jgi:hypothetical protein
MQVFFEDLALPHLIRTQLAEVPEWKSHRAGFTSDGTPNNLHVVRSMRGAIGRRIAWAPSSRRELRELEASLALLKPRRCRATRHRRASASRRWRSRSHRRAAHRSSASPTWTRSTCAFATASRAGAHQQGGDVLPDGRVRLDGRGRKELSKRFFILLYLFLTRHYEKIDIVFIRHHTQAQEVDEENFFHATETGGTVVSSALVLMEEIIRARYNPSEWNIYGAQASDGDNWHHDSGRCRELLARRSCRWCATTPTCRWPTKSRTCGRSTPSCWRPTPLRDAQGHRAPPDLPGVPRPVQEGRGAGRMSARLSSLGRPPRCRRARRPSRCRPSDWSFELIEQLPRGDPRHGRALRPGHLPQPARDHHRRADDGRLRQRRHAGELPPLELRQGVHRHREELQARPHGPGLRDRHQLQPLHQLPDGGEHDGDAGAGHRARRLRPQQLLQGQLPVPHVDRCVVDHRLPGLRQELRRRLRGAPRPGRRGDLARQLPCAGQPRRRPLPPAQPQARWRRSWPSARTARPMRSSRSTTCGARCRGAPRRPRRRRRQALPRGAAGEPAVLHREERAAARALAARDRAHRAQGGAVLLPAAPDPGDERGLGHLLAPPAAQHRCTTTAG